MSDVTEAVATAVRHVAYGLYRIDGSVAPDRLRQLLDGDGLAVFYIDGTTVSDKASFLRASASALRFPPGSGQNWDALEELLRDLEWEKASGYVVVYENPARLARGSPTDWATALEILRSTVEFWRDEGTAMWVLLTGDTSGLSSIPRLS